MLNSSELLTGVAGEHFGRAHPPMRISLCARISFVTSARPSTQNGWGTVRPAYCGELFTHHDTSVKSSSPCCMVVVLIVSKYICKHFSTLWVCALIPNYSPSRWRLECICIHCERKWPDKTIPMTEVILQILITLSIGIETLPSFTNNYAHRQRFLLR